MKALLVLAGLWWFAQQKKTSGGGGGGASPPPVPPPIPTGYSRTARGPGLHGEMGTAYWYPNGDAWFVPDDTSLVPYRVPGGSKDLPQ